MKLLKAKVPTSLNTTITTTTKQTKMKLSLAALALLATATIATPAPPRPELAARGEREDYYRCCDALVEDKKGLIGGTFAVCRFVSCWEKVASQYKQGGIWVPIAGVITPVCKAAGAPLDL
ncbi:hypothetical protein FQN51_002940 [Onygenales sp. PD_10]|nr:hypothetical protein FQN51_002940 [Onygenales sp. PD_10]